MLVKFTTQDHSVDNDGSRYYTIVEMYCAPLLKAENRDNMNRDNIKGRVMKIIRSKVDISEFHVPRQTPYLYNLLLLVAFVVLALNLRAPLTSLPSVINDIKADLHISSGIAGLLTSIPVLCFGVLTPVASAILSRIRIERAIYFTLFGVMLGILLRSSGGLRLTLVGTVLLGASLTLGNIASLLVMARDFRRQFSLINGIYVAAMSAGALLTAALTAPLASIVGWRAALAAWSVLAIFAIVLWFSVSFVKQTTPASNSHPVQFSEPEARTVTPASLARAVWRRAEIQLLAIAFASHTFIFYAVTAWLPDYLKQAGGMDSSRAGMAAALFQILGILGSFSVSWLGSAARFSTAKLFLIVGGAWFFMPTGLLMLPQLWPIWMVLGGIGTGGGFVIVFSLVMALSGSLDENRRISSFVQGVGYVIASTGPTMLGFLHQLTNNWHSGFMLLAFTALLMGATGFVAAKTH